MSRKSEFSISRLRAIEQVEEKTIRDAEQGHRLNLYGAIVPAWALAIDRDTLDQVLAENPA
jgi:hypothetical protein